MCDSNFSLVISCEINFGVKKKINCANVNFSANKHVQNFDV